MVELIEHMPLHAEMTKQINTNIVCDSPPSLSDSSDEELSKQVAESENAHSKVMKEQAAFDE